MRATQPGPICTPAGAGADGGGASEWLPDVADLVQVALGLAALLAFLSTRVLVLRLLLAAIYGFAISPVHSLPSRMAARVIAAARFHSAVGDRFLGSPWSIRDEYRTLGLALRRQDPLPWCEDAPLSPIAAAYRRSEARLRRSIALRLRSSDVIEREASLAVRTAAALEIDADYRRATFGNGRSRGGLRALFEATATEILVAPPKGLSGGYDQVRCSLIEASYGAPQQPFSQLQEPNWPQPGTWNVADDQLSRRLDDRVRVIAADRVAKRQDFNGALVRLADWRTEQSNTSLSRRLHLLVQPTNFASLLATNGGLRKPFAMPADRDTLLDLSLHSPTVRQPRHAVGANALAVHVTLWSSDHLLVLVRRSEDVEWAPGQLNTAANGLIEYTPEDSPRFRDEDENGFIDAGWAAVREAHEEIGEHLRLAPRDLLCRALALNVDESDQITPYLVYEARSRLRFGEIVAGHFAHASRAEGAFEVGREIIGLPMKRTLIGPVAAWLRHEWDRGRISPSGLATTLLALRHLGDEAQILTGWRRPLLRWRAERHIHRHPL